MTQRHTQVQRMFTAISARYDFLNRLLSLRADVSWRRLAVGFLSLPDGGRVLDLATGTGDLAIEVVRRAPSGVRVVGVDFSEPMLRLADEKSRRAGCGERVQWIGACGEAMPFSDEVFHAALIAFGIRNFPDRTAGLREIYRVLVRGGMVVILELTTPRSALVRWAYRAYGRHVLPRVAGLFARRGAYEYLTSSVEEFPGADDFAETIQSAGYRHVRYHLLTGGIATVFVGVKDGCDAAGRSSKDESGGRSAGM